MSDLQRLSGGRYRVIEPIGAGGMCRVFLAEEPSGELWAAKEYRLVAAPDWKSWELFERGAAVLSGLDHPGVPRFGELIRAEDDANPRLWLIEEYIPGANLRDLVASGTTFELVDVIRIGCSVLGVLDYLHRRNPAVVHRDVKPSNIILKPDRGVVLVDFGAVQQALGAQTMSGSAGLGGSTVVGTYGYMPPEQYMGRAQPASDLYGLGATLVFLLTGKEPAQLEIKDMRLDFVDAVRGRHGPTTDARLLRVLHKLLAPRIEDRYASARAASAELAVCGREVLRRTTRPELPAIQLPVTEQPGGSSEIHAALAALIAADPSPSAGAPPQAHAEPGPRPTGQPGRALPCPGCGETMRPVVLGQSQTEVDLCPRCHGMWLDHGELGQLVARPVMLKTDLADIRRRVKAIRKQPSAVVYRRCPVCEATMHRRNFGRHSGVIIDECARHGAFFDAGELEAIQEFVRLGGMELADQAQREEDRRSARVSAMKSTIDRPIVGEHYERRHRATGIGAAVDLMASIFSGFRR